MTPPAGEAAEAAAVSENPAPVHRGGQPPNAPLRLLVQDEDDLAILSANLQDMQIAVRDMAFLPEQKRFALAGKRFDWVKAAAGGCERCATGLHFDFVLGVARSGFTQIDHDRTLNLLALHFQPGALPAGTVTLTFSGGAAVRLTVDCVDAQMRDLGERWPCSCQPAHPLDDGVDAPAS